MTYYYECWKCPEWHELAPFANLKEARTYATVKRLKPHRQKFRTGHNGGGRLFLIPLPFGLGLNIGRGFGHFGRLRSWEWARYDYADYDPQNSERWNTAVLGNGTPPAPSGKVARFVDGYRKPRAQR
jgi:hypothetical protein